MPPAYDAWAAIAAKGAYRWTARDADLV